MAVSNLEYILSLPEPEYKSIKTYRRGLRSKVNWVQAITGKYHKDVVYGVVEYHYKDPERGNP